jgi:parallel beta-helix repeat protein
MTSRFCSLGILFVLIFSTAYLFSETYGTTAPESGDWVITKNITVESESIVLKGDLIIKDGGKFILNNSQLEISSDYVGEHKIKVEKGGILSTEKSTIKSLNEASYKFIVFGELTIINSTIENVWGDVDRVNRRGGIEINSNETYFENSEIIKGLTNGLLYSSSKINIINCRVTLCQDDAIEIYSSFGIIDGCNISDNGWGIVAFNSNISVKNSHIHNMVFEGLYAQNSKLDVINNTFSYHDTGLYDGGGALTVELSKADILNNNFYKNYWSIVASASEVTIENNSINGISYGIQVNNNSRGLIKGNTVSNNDLFGIQVMDSDFEVTDNIIFDIYGTGLLIRNSNPIITNVTIWNYNEIDYQFYTDTYCLYDANPTYVNCNFTSIGANTNCDIKFINTPINLSNIGLDRSSSIALKFSLDIKVIDNSNNPVQNATIGILSKYSTFMTRSETSDQGTSKTILLDGINITGSREWKNGTSVYSVQTNYETYRIIAYKERLGFGRNHIELDKNENIIIKLNRKNEPPEIIDFEPNGTVELIEGNSQEFNITVDDEYIDYLLFDWYIDDIFTLRSKSRPLNYTTNYSSQGYHNIKVVVTDGIFSDSHTWNVNVIEIEDIDTDGDGIINKDDPDDDNDGYSDEMEIEFGTDKFDKLDHPEDNDNDFIPNEIDDDIDNDSYKNSVDMFPYDPNEWENTDGDHWGDNRDPDDDNDGYSDIDEVRTNSDPKDRNSTPPDMDNDYTPDDIDYDRDGDGIPNDSDAYPDDPDKYIDETIEKDTVKPVENETNTYLILGVYIFVIISILVIIIWLNKIQKS